MDFKGKFSVASGRDIIGEMFEIPDAKRVRREDLVSTSGSELSSRASSSRSPSPRTLSHLETKLESHFSTSYEPSDPLSSHGAPQVEDLEQETYAFRLFSGGSTAPQKVRLHSPSSLLPEGPGSFVSTRPQSHYILSPPSPNTSAKFASSAISHSTIKSLAWTRWPGLVQPWRVNRLVLSKKRARRLVRTPPIITSSISLARIASLESSSSAPLARTTTTAESRDRKGRTKPNKKRRLIVRQRQRAAAAEEARRVENEARVARDKEEQEARDRLKKAARNRAKRARKVKKAKATKLDGQGNAEGVVDE